MASIKNKRKTSGSVRWLLLALAAFLMGVAIMDRSYGSEISTSFLEQTATSLSGSSSSLRATEATVTSTASDWPGIAVEELGYPLVKKGRTFVDQSRELLIEQHLDEFLAVYRDRPDKRNLCGIRINHAYALFIAVKFLQPTTIIESGVNAGQSTYFMRAASPNAKIFAIDPLDKPICGQEKRWIDEKNAVYYTGANFQDIGAIDWAGKIKAGEVDPEKTLVFLDDHLEVFHRFVALMKNGFRHVLLEDNYKKREGATRQDKAGWTPKQMLHRIDDDSKFLWNNLVTYAEFPPLVAPILAKETTNERKAAGGFLHPDDNNKDIVAPILRAETNQEDKILYEKICKVLEVDPRLIDFDSYMQVMNYNQFTYFELLPMAPQLRSKWTAS
jgi:hypothetical protein